MCAAAAAVTAFSCLTFNAFAEESEEKKEIPFTADKTMTTTESSEPAVSFDGDDWNKYVHLTPDSEKIGLKISIDKTTYYQGFSLKATASASQRDEFFLHAATVKDADNNLVFPGSDAEDAKFICPGVELRCEDFGLSCFDGCFVSFVYRLGADAEGKLMDSSVYAFATDENYAGANSSLVTLKYDVLMNNNVSQYRSESISVPANSASTRIVFETPVLDKMDSEAVCLDNISIMLPIEEEGKSLYIKSLDDYNAGAKPQETIEEIQIKEKKESTVEIADAKEKQEGGNGFIVVIIIIVVVIAGGVGAFFFIKKKKQYY